MRNGLSESEHARLSKIICEKVKEHLNDAKAVMLYSPIDSEVDVSLLFDEDKTVLLPRVEGEKLIPCVKKELNVGSFGVLEPVGEGYCDKIDAVIVPMCAFDKNCNRLGFGKGYYDRFLASIDTLKIGVAFSCQEQYKIFANETDVKMDIIITETSVLRCDG